MSNYEIITQVLDEQGVFYRDDIIDTELISSIQYVTIIIELENRFQISFPEKYLNGSLLTTISQLDKIITEIKENIYSC
jgi:acyl carrier protein